MSDQQERAHPFNDKWSRSGSKSGKKPKPRYDENGTLLCHAHTQRGTLCMAPAISGGRVCRVHGGSASQVKRAARLRLAELVNPAIATLAREMANAEKSSDRQRAANSILDRAGISRVQKIEGADAREMLKQRLAAIKEAQEKAEREALADFGDDDDADEQ